MVRVDLFHTLPAQPPSAGRRSGHRNVLQAALKNRPSTV